MKSFKNSLKELENSKEFKDWKKENPDTFLSYGFFMLNEKEESSWKIGYYNKKKDRITSFVVANKIEIEPESEVFKEESTKVEKIDLKKLKVEIDKSLEIAKRMQEEKYQKEKPNKVIIILQSLKIGLIWNITYITYNMNTLNFKINAEKGNILEYKLTSLFDFRK